MMKLPAGLPEMVCEHDLETERDFVNNAKYIYIYTSGT